MAGRKEEGRDGHWREGGRDEACVEGGTDEGREVGRRGRQGGSVRDWGR